MANVRFHAGDVDLEVSGSETFVTRQLLLLAPLLGDVDPEALRTPSVRAGPEPVEVPPTDGTSQSEPHGGGNGCVADPVPKVEAARADEENDPPETEVEEETGSGDGLRDFYLENQPKGRDVQTDAALLIAYYLSQVEGRESLRMGDLVHSCIRAGVDTRNLNRPLGILTRRGLLEASAGSTYRISSQGVRVVESRL